MSIKLLHFALFLFITNLSTRAQVVKSEITNFAEAKREHKATWHCSYFSVENFMEIDKTTGRPTGIGAEIMANFSAYVKKQYDITVDIQYEELDGGTVETLNKIKLGKESDFGVIFLYSSAERKQKYNLSRPLYIMPVYLISSNNLQEVKSAADVSKLNGRNAYVLKESFFDQEFKRIESKYKLSFHYRYLEDENVHPEKDPMRLQFVPAPELLNVTKSGLKTTIHSFLQLNVPNVIILSDKNSWTEEFNKFLLIYTATPSYKQTLIKHLGVSTYNMIKLPN